MKQKDGLFYGWFIVVVCFLILFSLWGVIINTFGVFLKPVSESMGWDRMTYSLLLGIGALAMAFAAPFIGKIIDIFGARKTMLTGCIVCGVGVILLGFAMSWAQFVFLFIIVGFGLGATTVVPVSLIVANWFEQKRGLAMGATMMGTSVGGLIMNPVNSQLVEAFGWRHSYMILGTGMLLVTLPLVFLVIRTKPSEIGLFPDGREPVEKETKILSGHTLGEAVRTSAFWFIAANMFLTNVMANAIGVHGIPYLTDIGHSAFSASIAIGLSMGFMTVGKVVLGRWADRWGARPVFTLSAIMTALGIGVLMLASPLWVALLFAFVYGFPQGGPLTLTPMVTADCHGLANFGAIFGLLTLISIAGAAIGPVIVGRMYDASGSYQSAFILLIVITLLSAFCIHNARHAEGKGFA